MKKNIFVEKLNNMEDKVIEIARFKNVSEAEVLASLFKSEGIECFVRDTISSHSLFGVMDIKVDLLLKDARRAMEIMRDHDYDIPQKLSELNLPDEQEYDDSGVNNDIIDDEVVNDEEFFDETSEEDSAIDSDEIAKRKAKLSKQMTVILIILAILFGLLVFLNKYYNG